MAIEYSLMGLKISKLNYITSKVKLAGYAIHHFIMHLPLGQQCLQRHYVFRLFRYPVCSLVSLDIVTTISISH